jgi:hypothetical protein
MGNYDNILATEDASRNGNYKHHVQLKDTLPPAKLIRLSLTIHNNLKTHHTNLT